MCQFDKFKLGKKIYLSCRNVMKKHILKCSYNPSCLRTSKIKADIMKFHSILVMHISFNIFFKYLLFFRDLMLYLM